MSLAVGRMEANYSDNISDPYSSDSFQKGILGTKENGRIKKKKTYEGKFSIHEYGL